jgi:hypothetical protein
MHLLIWHLTSVVLLLVWAGGVIAWFYILYQGILFARRRQQGMTPESARNTWLQTVEVPEIARPHARKMRNGIVAVFVCFAVGSAAVLLQIWVGFP